MNNLGLEEWHSLTADHRKIQKSINKYLHLTWELDGKMQSFQCYIKKGDRGRELARKPKGYFLDQVVICTNSIV